MPVVSCVILSIPATSANLGPGFDCIGVALTLYSKFKFTRLESGNFSITVKGLEAKRVKTDSSNLSYQAFIKLYKHIQQKPPPVNIEITLGIPLARGLGSSATAIVGGLVGANELAGKPLNQFQLMELAIAIEGHPDNVVPALIGGCRLAVTSQTSWTICDVPWHKSIIPIVAIPDFEISTEDARKVLPTQVSRADTIFNTAHLGLLLRGLATGRGDWLKTALQDKLHQPYRKQLITGYDTVNSAAIDVGAYGMVISGAGPTLLALTDMEHSADIVAAITATWQQYGIIASVQPLSIDQQGVKIIS
ncbi:Homoserine kinase [Richelia intracellularis HM01]|uniref:homoserine kinase n=1 Tax=Richelia intracellularis TaxID=1164990 RepID=UPI0002B55CF5|nr:homoserine kinase [Richelia intracellularis]CCH65942.1 Homoserine kinase [Richelia intracellularis HM01]